MKDGSLISTSCELLITFTCKFENDYLRQTANKNCHTIFTSGDSITNNILLLEVRVSAIDRFSVLQNTVHEGATKYGTVGTESGCSFHQTLASDTDVTNLWPVGILVQDAGYLGKVFVYTLF